MAGNSVLIIADARFPEAVKKKLETFGSLVCFSAPEIVYDSLSGHPDIFLCQTPSGLIAAPNTPKRIIDGIKKFKTKLITGTLPVGRTYPASARYNAFVGENLLIHNTAITDHSILQSTLGHQVIRVKQGYARCNLVSAGNLFITSDRGIEKAMHETGRDVFFVDPAVILLPGQKNGFFGGCAGYFNHRLYIAGNSGFFGEGPLLKQALEKRGIELIELYDGPLWDGGGIFFVTK